MEIRQARIADVAHIGALVSGFAERGEILPRTLEQLYQTVREWVVAEQAGRIVGCASLAILWADMAEIRSLVVDPAWQGMGVGRGLVEALLGQAAHLDIPQVFALTRKPGFFDTLGFHVVPRDSLPRKIWKDCLTCDKFAYCDEVAVLREVAVDVRLEGWKIGWLEERNNERLEERPAPAAPRGPGKNGKGHHPSIQPSNHPITPCEPSNLPLFLGPRGGAGAGQSSNHPIIQPRSANHPSPEGATDHGHSPD